MWYLTEEKFSDGRSEPSPKYWLGGTATSGRTIGRKHVDIRLKASSVSRTHAKISVLKAAFYTPTGDSRQSTSVSVQDSSAYGTFLKYPEGHTSNRGEVAGHHRRLDKDTPTDVCEGALLAFGAPSAWWRVAWNRTAVLPSRLTTTESNRLDQISAATSLEVVDTWSEVVTHLIVSTCHATSMKFLTALANGNHVVTTSWAEGVNSVVTNACKAITEARTEEAVVLATSLPDEKHHAPSFSKEDESTFSHEVLNSVFDPAKRGLRKDMLRGVVLAFAREERRARWVVVVETLGGRAILARAARTRAMAEGSKLIFVKEDARRGREAESERYIAESVLVEAILRADLAPLTTSMEPVMNQAEVTDVATPGPLDADSDVDSDDTERTNPGKSQRRAQTADAIVDNLDSVEKDDVAGTKRKRSRPKEEQKKRVRPSPSAKEVGRPSRADAGGNDPQANPNDVANEHEINPEVEIDHANVNERAFFTIGKVAAPPRPSEPRSTGIDVRPFRRKNVSSQSTIPLKRVSCRDNELEASRDAHAAANVSRDRNRGRSADRAASVDESEEE